MPAGECAVLTGDEIASSGLTTHNLSPRMVLERLKQETTAALYLLGIQPHSVSFGEELSEEVRNTLSRLVSQIVQACPRTGAAVGRFGPPGDREGGRG